LGAMLVFGFWLIFCFVGHLSGGWSGKISEYKIGIIIMHQLLSFCSKSSEVLPRDGEQKQDVVEQKNLSELKNRRRSL
jgi:hypothetical protein